MSNNLVHTPGPWVYIHEHGKGYVEPENETPNGDYIMTWRYQRDIRQDEAKANGMLIAAAPDLLNACQYVLLFIEDAMRLFNSTEQSMEYTAAAKLRAAISKATKGA